MRWTKLPEWVLYRQWYALRDLPARERGFGVRHRRRGVWGVQRDDPDLHWKPLRL